MMSSKYSVCFLERSIMRLEVENLRKTFGNTEILHGISFQVESGTALGLLGRNGAGKTTTIRILMDVFKKNSGNILLDGREFIPRNYQIGYLPEERGLYPKKTVMEQLVYMGRLRGMGKKAVKENIKFWLDRMDVLQYADRKLETLSKGNQQKVQFIQTLICDPDILILDEPFSGLDPVNAQVLKDVIKEQISAGKLVIFSSHQMNYVEEFCEEIAILNHGEIALSGNLRDIKRQYGEGRLMMCGQEISAEELAENLNAVCGDLLEVERIIKDKIIVRQKSLDSKNQILRRLLDNHIDLEFFGLYEPTLNDIFIESAGDES